MAKIHTHEYYTYTYIYIYIIQYISMKIYIDMHTITPTANLVLVVAGDRLHRRKPHGLHVATWWRELSFGTGVGVGKHADA